MISAHPIFKLRRQARPGMNLALGTMEKLLQALGKPHLRYHRVLVAGTNGKGSTASLLTEFCQALSIPVGLFTSPHLISLNERFRVNQRWIRDEELLYYLRKVEGAAKKERLKPTFFEFVTAMAHCFFAQQEIDLAIFEVGLGGRLDATKVGNAELVLFSSISHDHEEFLGYQLSQIAAEKAALIPPKGWVLSSPQSPEVMTVIDEEVRRKKAQLLVDGKDFSLQQKPSGLVQFQLGRYGLPAFHCPLEGAFQRKNLALAMAAICLLVDKGWGGQILEDPKGFPLSLGQLKQILPSHPLPGRFQILPRQRDKKNKPYLVLDGAHNPDAMTQVFATFREKKIPFERLHVVLALKKNASWQEILKRIPATLASLTLTEMESQNDAGPLEFVSTTALLKECLRQNRMTSEKISSCRSAWKAFQRAQKQAGEEDWVLATGSLYLVGKILSHFPNALSDSSGAFPS